MMHVVRKFKFVVSIMYRCQVTIYYVLLMIAIYMYFVSNFLKTTDSQSDNFLMISYICI